MLKFCGLSINTPFLLLDLKAVKRWESIYCFLLLIKLILEKVAYIIEQMNFLIVNPRNRERLTHPIMGRNRKLRSLPLG